MTSPVPIVSCDTPPGVDHTQGQGCDGPGETRNEASLRRLLEMSCDWYWMLDAKWRLIRLNGKQFDDAGPSPIQAQLGKAPWDWPGVLVDRPDFAQLRDALLQHRRFHELEYRLRDPCGHLHYLGVSGEPVFDGSGGFAGYRGTTRDLTHDKRADALLALEHAVTRCLAEAANSRKVLQGVMRVICESEDWETAGFFRVEDSHGTTRLIAGWTAPNMAQVATDYFSQTTDRVIPPGGRLSQVIASGKPLWVDAMTETQTSWAHRVLRNGERATLFCPVLIDVQVFGVFAFTTRDVREPDERLLLTLAVIGEQVGQFLKRKQAEQVLRESEARFRALTGLSSDWYWELDVQLHLTCVEGREVEGADPLPARSAIGKPYRESGLQLEDAGGWDAHVAQLLERQPFRDVVMRQDCTDGTRRYVSTSGEPMHDHKGGFIGYRGVARDVTDRRRAEIRIQHLAAHDEMTGLPNRVMFSELLAQAILSAEHGSVNVAVLFIDLDRFKVINDTLGHNAGDTLLKEIAHRLTGCLRTGDVVARLGGDEFVVLLQQVDGEDDVATVARKILVAVALPASLEDREYRVTASVGISIYGIDADNEQSLMQNADVAMYVAKQAGKNRFQVYSQEIALQSSRRLALEDRLRGALERNEFFIHYQPKVDLKTGVIVGVEALLRWNSPELGLVSPLQFIPLAEETGQILAIGKWVLQMACEQAMAWQRQGLPPLTMAVNLSARQFSDEFLLGDVAVTLHETGMPSHLLELEITEGMLIQNVDRAVKLLTAIKRMGVRLAIDDFGTGYSSLGQLKALPIDTLKIDRSFICDLPSNPEDKAIIEAIIAMARALGLTVVAEGVETRDQANFLREHDCDQMQGYYFGRPIGAREFAAMWWRHAEARTGCQALSGMAGRAPIDFESGRGGTAPQPHGRSEPRCQIGTGGDETGYAR